MSTEKLKTTRQKILLVEDDPSNALVETTFLETLGYDYDVAPTAKEVFHKISKTPYSLILMDVNLPGIGGIAATQQLRDMERAGLLPPTPIMAITAHAMVADRQRCLEAGMDDYLPKPFSFDDLRLKIERYMTSTAI